MHIVIRPERRNYYIEDVFRLDKSLRFTGTSIDIRSGQTLLIKVGANIYFSRAIIYNVSLLDTIQNQIKDINHIDITYDYTDISITVLFIAKHTLKVIDNWWMVMLYITKTELATMLLEQL